MPELRRRLGSFRQPIARPKRVGPEHNPWFWNPNNPSVRFAPEWFLKKLRELGEELSCTWDPIKEKWLVWARMDRMNHPICRGWRLLFVHHDGRGGYLPLDERVFGRLYQASVHEHGSAKQYFHRIQAEMERDEERKEATLRQDAIDRAMPYWEHSQIKNIGKGSKFSTYHS